MYLLICIFSFFFLSIKYFLTSISSLLENNYYKYQQNLEKKINIKKLKKK